MRCKTAHIESVQAIGRLSQAHASKILYPLILIKILLLSQEIIFAPIFRNLSKRHVNIDDSMNKAHYTAVNQT